MVYAKKPAKLLLFYELSKFFFTFLCFFAFFQQKRTN